MIEFGRMEQAVIDFRKNLGKRIKQLREECELNQLELAAKLNKDKQFINRYEKNGANPSAYILLTIAEALGVPIAKLYDFSSL
jgi:putative transcriptional regulator